MDPQSFLPWTPHREPPPRIQMRTNMKVALEKPREKRGTPRRDPGGPLGGPLGGSTASVMMVSVPVPGFLFCLPGFFFFLSLSHHRLSKVTAVKLAVRLLFLLIISDCNEHRRKAAALVPVQISRL